MEVIIIDNCSTDNSIQWIKNEYPSKIHIIELKENLGFGKANNIGISMAVKLGADYVFLQNQDVYLHSDCIEKLIKNYQENKEYAILSPIHYNGSGTAIDYWFSTYMSPPRCKNLVSDIFLNKKLNKIYDTNLVNAAAWMLSKEILKELGGFHPAFFHYGEDSNYCERVMFYGYKIGIIPDAKCNHDRETRPLNEYEKNDLLILERELTKKFAFPNSANSKSIYYLKNFILILIDIFSFKTKNILSKFYSIKIIYKFSIKNIKTLNSEFRLGGYSYLNF
jgi:GT2 family glycosyltransferase